MKSAKRPRTVATVVCCSIISLTRTRYGSGDTPGGERQGSSRRARSYQASRVARSSWGGPGSVGRARAPVLTFLIMRQPETPVSGEPRRTYATLGVDRLVGRVLGPVARRRGFAEAAILA